MKQHQFLDVVDEATARARFAAATAHLVPRAETVPLDEALGRVLAEDARAPVDVPGFDRSNVDGFAVRAADTFGAQELRPARLRLAAVSLAAGRAPAPGAVALAAGEAMAIATGAVLPRGADAVVMVEDTAPGGAGELELYRPVAPGDNLTSAGTDLGRGEVVLRRGERLSSRETGLLAAVGLERVAVFARPRVAVLSTGDEVRPPGAPLSVGEVYDSNGRVLADAVRELGGEPVPLGIVPDEEAALAAALSGALGGGGACELVLLSGGTSKGAGDLAGRVIAGLAERLPDSPGLVVRGVALKPGKPLGLGVLGGRALAILPGFPTSAIFTFHEFLAPLVLRLAGRRADALETVEAVAPLRIPSAAGRTEYCLVDLVPGPRGLAAYPLGSGSGSVSTFSRADGFVRIDQHTEFIEEGARVAVRPLQSGGALRAADLVAIGSHCVGLDWLLSRLSAAGWRTKAIAVGSQGGLAALARGEGDVAGTHLLDPESGLYNTPFLPSGVRVMGGYGRRQGVVWRRGDERFEGLDLERLKAAVRREGVVMVNRNRGSGTRVLIDRFLAGAPGEPPGHATQARSHHAVAAAVAQGRADWGVTLDVLAEDSGLGFQFLQEERFELVAREDRWDRPAVAALRESLGSEEVRRGLAELGLVP